MKTLIIILISTIIILAAFFLPIYNGRVGGCGVVEGGGCWNYKLNLIEYIKYRDNPQPELLKECPDEKIINNMPGSSKSSYYIKNRVRKEISDYNNEWVKVNCNVPVQNVY